MCLGRILWSPIKAGPPDIDIYTNKTLKYKPLVEVLLPRGGRLI